MHLHLGHHHGREALVVVEMFVRAGTQRHKPSRIMPGLQRRQRLVPIDKALIGLIVPEGVRDADLRWVAL